MDNDINLPGLPPRLALVHLGTSSHQLAQGLSDCPPYIRCLTLVSAACRPHLSLSPTHECLDAVMFHMADNVMHPQEETGTPQALVVLLLCCLSAGAKRSLRIYFGTWALSSGTVSQTGSPLELGQKWMPHATPRAADLSGK